LSSGEGLIHQVRDAREEQQPVKERGSSRVIEYQTVVVDEGVKDKRLLIVEPELTVVLKRLKRESNSLSAVMRLAWDTGDLGTITKQSPDRANGAHISILAHITQAELALNLTSTERINGFANRFMFTLVRRSKELPKARPVPEETMLPLARDLQAVVDWAREPHVIERDPVAEVQWETIYHDLSAERPGMLGAITGRAEAHVLRLGVLYAVLDCARVVTPDHSLRP
jgi:hypothetical protein